MLSRPEAPRPRVAIVLKGYPRLSETFVAQEILGLKRLGLPLCLVALREPTEDPRHPVHDEIDERPNYLPEYLYWGPRRVLRAWWTVRRFPGYRAARRAFLKDWARDPTANRGRRFGQALVLAAEMPADVGLIYVHFFHTPGSVARYAAKMLDIPFACSAHAKDIWTTPDWEKREKLGDCEWVVTCTATNAAHLGALAAARERVELVYHGLDFARFPPPEQGIGETGGRDGSDPDRPVRLLAVGRLVEKKGHAGLLEALALLPPDLAWSLGIVGGGPLKAKLRRRAARLGIGDRVHFLGVMTQDAVLARYRTADLFVLNCRISGDGDRDGLPNVLMEAQSQGLPCVSTRVSAIPELIVDGVTGRLVPEDDPSAMAGALCGLIADPSLRRRLGEAGKAHVKEHFGHDEGVRRIHERLLQTLGASA